MILVGYQSLAPSCGRSGFRPYRLFVLWLSGPGCLQVLWFFSWGSCLCYRLLKSMFNCSPRFPSAFSPAPSCISSNAACFSLLFWFSVDSVRCSSCSCFDWLPRFWWPFLELRNSCLRPYIRASIYLSGCQLLFLLMVVSVCRPGTSAPGPVGFAVSCGSELFLQQVCLMGVLPVWLWLLGCRYLGIYFLWWLLISAGCHKSVFRCSFLGVSQQAYMLFFGFSFL